MRHVARQHRQREAMCHAHVDADEDAGCEHASGACRRRRREKPVRDEQHEEADDQEGVATADALALGELAHGEGSHDHRCHVRGR
jgi:hypothetical protein